jgi:acyl-CoA reductase-like NAD-dependent aldehyde dehydrogenase
MDTLHNFIDGRWVDAPERAPAISPATGQQIAWSPKSDRAIARDAIAAAKRAQAGWAKTSVWKRAEMCVAIAASIDEGRADRAHAEPGARQAASASHRRGHEGRRRLSTRRRTRSSDEG